MEAKETTAGTGDGRLGMRGRTSQSRTDFACSSVAGRGQICHFFGMYVVSLRSLGSAGIAASTERGGRAEEQQEEAGARLMSWLEVVIGVPDAFPRCGGYSSMFCEIFWFSKHFSELK